MAAHLDQILQVPGLAVAEVLPEAVVRGQLALHIGLETAAAPLLPVHELLAVLTTAQTI